MDRHVRSIAGNHGRISVATFYSEPKASDAAGYSHDHDGFITVDWLMENTPFEKSEFYLCGPKPFLRSLVRGLSHAGVDPKHIHFEFFGPADELIVA
jgi:nitric oxide dioxygenase